MNLTKAETKIMKVIWAADESLSMEAVRAQVNEKYNTQWASQTVTTFLMRLEKKGALERERRGRVFYYTPLISEAETRESALQEFLELWDL